MSRITLDDIKSGNWNIGDVLWLNPPSEEEAIGILMKERAPMLLTKHNPHCVTSVVLKDLYHALETVEVVYEQELKKWRQLVLEEKTQVGFDQYMYKTWG